MTPRMKTFLMVGTVVLIIVLILSCMQQCQEKEIARMKLRAQNAFYDTIVLIDTVWQKDAIPVSAKEALTMKIPDPETKKWLVEIAKQKNIIQALQIRLQSSDSTRIALIPVNTDSSTAVEWGDFTFSDTLGNLQVSGEVNFSDTNALKLKYLYNLVVQSSIKEEKDRFVASYSTNDTNVKLIGADNLFIPKKPTKKKKVASIVTPIGTFFLGLIGGLFINK